MKSTFIFVPEENIYRMDKVEIKTSFIFIPILLLLDIVISTIAPY